MQATKTETKAPLKQGRLRHFWTLALGLAALCAGSLNALTTESPSPSVTPVATPVSGTTAASVTKTAAASAPAVGTSPLSSLRQGFDEGKPIDIQGRIVSYRQEDETLLAEGGVVLESGDARIHAERLWYNLKGGTLRAEGDVVVEGQGNTLWAEKVAMDQLSRTGEAEDLVFYQHPWTAACKGATLLPGDVLELTGCECTSCLQEHPHWRMKAGRLKIKAGERLWVNGMVLYAGRVPVFYLPYYSQSLKDGRPPIEIKPGYSKPLGAYVRTAYNYYLGDGEYGSVRYDWMDRKGSGYGLGHHYSLLGGEGDAAGYFTVDKNDPSRQDWSANFRHRQDFGHGLSLLGNVDLLSNYAFNETYDISQVDVFQRRSFLSLQSGQADHSWSLQAGETQVLQTARDISGTVVSRDYVVTQRQLPLLNYTLYQKPVREGSPLYWGVDAHAGRQLVVPLTVTAFAGSTVYDTARSYYLTDVGLSPNLSHTQRLTRHLSLNSNANLNQSWQKQEGVDGYGLGVSSYGTYFNLQERWNSSLTTSFGHRHQRQISQIESLRWAGLLNNRLEARADWHANEDISVFLNTDYDLLPYLVDSDLKRLGLVRAQASYSPDADRSLSLSTGWHAPTGALKTVDLNGNLNDRKQRWQVNGGLNWVNNRIVPAAPTLDIDAPYELREESPRATPDQLLASSRLSLALGPKWHISYFERLDLTARRLDEQAFSLWRDFTCIDSEIYARETVLGGWQYGFALSLSALPNVRVSSNQVTNDLFQPVQFGY